MSGSATAMKDRFVVPPDDHAPIATINTTPLIDVMLVLLIMFIIVVPVASHKVPLDLPQPSPTPIPAPPAVHRLDILAGGTLRWDGRPVDGASLPARFRALAADPARPELHLNPDAEANYGQVDVILAQVRRAGVTRLGFLDNQRFAEALDRS
jgi:biopolymer transport protein ExbD